MAVEDGFGLGHQVFIHPFHQYHILYLGDRLSQNRADQLLCGDGSGGAAGTLAQQLKTQYPVLEVQQTDVAAMKGQFGPNIRL